VADVYLLVKFARQEAMVAQEAPAHRPGRGSPQAMAD
jgi:hypothetical protein